MSQSRPTPFLGTPTEQALLLQKLNGQFLGQHDKTAQSSLEGVENVITFMNGHLTCHTKDEKQKAYIKIADEVVAPEFGPYTQVKQIAHLPLLILETLHDHSLSFEHTKNKLESIARDLTTIQASIPPTTEINKTQKEILAHSIEFLSMVTKRDYTKVELDQLLSFYIKKLQPALDYSMNFVTHVQLQSLHRIMSQWTHKHQLHLDKSRVLVVAPHGPREGLIEMQYFLDLYRKLGIPSPENNKVYMVEQLPQHFGLIKIEQDLIQHFLAVSERNKVIGQVFKNDQQFMFKDIFADKAPAVIKKLSDRSQHSFFKPDTSCPIMQKVSPKAERRSRL